MRELFFPPNYTGWLCGVRNDVTAELDDVSWYSGPCASREEAERRFDRAAARALLRRILAKVGVRIAPPRSWPHEDSATPQGK